VGLLHMPGAEIGLPTDEGNVGRILGYPLKAGHCMTSRT
jgi:hypothetical protein